MRRTKSTLAALAIGALSVSTLAACSDDDDDSPDTPTETTIGGAATVAPLVTTATS